MARASKLERLERLFEFYATDLSRYAPEAAGKFWCPLCHRVISRVPDLRDVVSEEHIVPEALGGRLVTLTCRGCNNEHGTSLDAHLVQRGRLEAKKKHLVVQEAALVFAQHLIRVCPNPSRELSTAITKIEEAKMHANAGIAHAQPRTDTSALPAGVELEKGQ